MSSTRKEEDEGITPIVTLSGRASIPPTHPGVVKEKIKVRKPSKGPGGFFKAVKGTVVTFIEGDTKSSPARRIKKAVQDSSNYHSPSDAVKINRQSAKTTTPRKRALIHMFDAEYKSADLKVNLHVYQDKDSATKKEEDNRSTETPPTPIPAPTSPTFVIKDAPITPSDIRGAKKRKRAYSHKWPATGIAAQFGFDGDFDESHFRAHSFKTIPAVSPTGATLISAPAHTEFNIKKLVSTEAPIRTTVMQSGLVFFSEVITMRHDDQGSPTLVVDKETITIKDENKSSSVTIELKNTPDVPATGLYHPSKALMAELVRQKPLKQQRRRR